VNKEKYEVEDKVKIVEGYCKGSTGTIKTTVRAGLPYGVQLDQSHHNGKCFHKERWVDFEMDYFWVGGEDDLERVTQIQ